MAQYYLDSPPSSPEPDYFTFGKAVGRKFAFDVAAYYITDDAPVPSNYSKKISFQNIIRNSREELGNTPSVLGMDDNSRSIGTSETASYGPGSLDFQPMNSNLSSMPSVQQVPEDRSVIKMPYYWNNTVAIGTTVTSYLFHCLDSKILTACEEVEWLDICA